MPPAVARAPDPKKEKEQVTCTLTPSTEAPSPEVEPQRACDGGGGQNQESRIQEFGSPKNETVWADSTKSKLGKAKFLRQIAESEFCRSAQGGTADTQKRDIAGNRIQCQLRKQIDAKQKISRALWDNTTGTDETIRYIGHSVNQLYRAHQATDKPLAVIERCLELRASRPPQEKLNDIFQKALEDERTALLTAQQHLLERIEDSGTALKELELGKWLLRQDMFKKRHNAVHSSGDNRLVGDGGDTPAQLPRVQQWKRTQNNASRPRSAGSPSFTLVKKNDSENPVQSPKGEPRDAEQLLADTNELCLVAGRLSIKNEEILRARENDCENAHKHSLEAMRKRLLQTVDLKKALERELRETGVAFREMEKALAETERQCEQHKVPIDKSKLGPPLRRKVADREPAALEDKQHDDLTKTVSNGVVAPTSRKLQIQEALQDEYRRKTAVLSKMGDIREQLQEDLRCKMDALKIDMQCSKLLTRPHSAHPSPPGNGSQKPLFRRRYEREAGVTATFGPGSSGW